jgi:hypothetical protein
MFRSKQNILYILVKDKVLFYPSQVKGGNKPARLDLLFFYFLTQNPTESLSHDGYESRR